MVRRRTIGVHSACCRSIWMSRPYPLGRRLKAVGGPGEDVTAAAVGSPADGAAVGAPGASSPPVGQTLAQLGAGAPAAVTGLRVSAVAPGCLGGPGGRPGAVWLDGQRTLLTPPSARNAAPGELSRPVSRTCAGRLFALKAGSCISKTVERCVSPPAGGSNSHLEWISTLSLWLRSWRRLPTCLCAGHKHPSTGRKRLSRT